MGTICAPLVADLFCFLSDNNQADVIDAFTSTSRYKTAK